MEAGVFVFPTSSAPFVSQIYQPICCNCAFMSCFSLQVSKYCFSLPSISSQGVFVTIPEGWFRVQIIKAVVQGSLHSFHVIDYARILHHYRNFLQIKDNISNNQFKPEILSVTLFYHLPEKKIRSSNNSLSSYPFFGLVSLKIVIHLS